MTDALDVWRGWQRTLCPVCTPSPIPEAARILCPDCTKLKYTSPDEVWEAHVVIKALEYDEPGRG